MATMTLVEFRKIPKNDPRKKATDKLCSKCHKPGKIVLSSMCVSCTEKTLSKK